MHLFLVCKRWTAGPILLHFLIAFLSIVQVMFSCLRRYGQRQVSVRTCRRNIIITAFQHQWRHYVLDQRYFLIERKRSFTRASLTDPCRLDLELVRHLYCVENILAEMKINLVTVNLLKCGVSRDWNTVHGQKETGKFNFLKIRFWRYRRKTCMFYTHGFFNALPFNTSRHQSGSCFFVNFSASRRFFCSCRSGPTCVSSVISSMPNSSSFLSIVAATLCNSFHHMSSRRIHSFFVVLL